MFDVNANQLIVPGTESPDLVSTLIKVNGRALPDTIRPYSIRITRCANRIPYALVNILDGDVAEQRFEISDTDILSPGHEIEIHAGYHGNNALVFKGIIVKHTLRVMQNKQSHLEIECKDEAIKMTIGRKNKYYYNQSDQDIISQVIRSGGLTSQVDDTSGNHAEMVQFHATDWDFIATRAEANGMLLLVKDGEIKVQKPDFEQDPKFPLQYGVNIFEFEGQMDARDQYPTVKAKVWNPDNQDLEESEPEGGGGLSIPSPPPAVASAAQLAGSSVGLELPDAPPNTDYSQVMGLEHWPLQHTGHLKSEEAQQWAKAQQIKGQLAKSQGRVKFQGIADIYPGDVIRLEKIGQRHTGNVYISAVTHEIRQGLWYVHAQFGLPKQWFAQAFEDVQDSPAAALVPAVHGLQIGVVAGLEGDPENAHRVQVRLPLLDNQGEGTWMRIACQDAGNNRGAFWRPEIGDEVVVGFLNEDPRQPIIVGMLNSSAKPAPLVASDDNHQKGWVTRSEMKWIFDDEKKSMTLETPVGKKVIIDEDADKIHFEDEHGNKIILEADGITIESANDLILKAAQEVKLEATNVNQKASGNFKVEGQGKTEVKAAGDVVVKGSFVKIN